MSRSHSSPPSPPQSLKILPNGIKLMNVYLTVLHCMRFFFFFFFNECYIILLYFIAYFFFFFFFFLMNGNTERAYCALSRVCIPYEKEGEVNVK